MIVSCFAVRTAWVSALDLRSPGGPAELAAAVEEGEVEERVDDNGTTFYFFKEIKVKAKTKKSNLQRINLEKAYICMS